MAAVLSRRILLVDNEDFAVELEYTNEYGIVHIKRVTHFNRAVLRRLQAYANELQDFLSIHYGRVYTAAELHRNDLHKLAPLLGYHEVGRDDTYIIYSRGQ